MLRHYFKIAHRNLLKHRSFSFINIFGLVTGMTACLLILQYVNFENSYDSFHDDHQDIYRISADIQEAEVRNKAMVPPPLGPDLIKEFPEVTTYTRLILPWSGQATASTLGWVNSKGKEIKNSFKWGFFVDPGFLEIFSFPLIKGDVNTALQGAHRVVLSEKAATKFFGPEWDKQDNIIGRTIEYVNEFDRFQLIVTGIISDPPDNSHFEYDFLASFQTLHTGWAKKGYMKSWNGNQVYTYLEMAPDTDMIAFAEKVNQFYDKTGEKYLDQNTELIMQPLRDIYLYSEREDELKVNASATHLSFLYMIALVILAIALMNYVNLTTAKSIARGHEVGMKKVIGALRHQLVKQFLFESLLINGIAFSLALVLQQLALPFFRELTGTPFEYPLSEFWVYVLTIFMVSVLLSGLYPAFVLSGYRPLQVLKGKLMQTQNGNQLRCAMVVFQFLASVSLIFFTSTIYRQLQFMQNEDTGFEKEGVIVIDGPRNRPETWIEHDRDRQNKYNGDLFKDAILPLANIRSVSLSWSVPGEKSSIYKTHLGEFYDHVTLDVVAADNNYAEVYGLELLAGQFNTDKGFVINESTSHILGYHNADEAIGQSFKDANNNSRQITGVVKDYHHHSLHETISPFYYKNNDPTYKLDSYYSVKVELADINASLDQIRTAYKEVYPNEVFNYHFIDSYFDAQYQSDIRFGIFFGIFSGLAIFIACLGLLGLSIHTVVVKRQEIGIRKVLGASVKNIVLLLTGSSMKLIMLGCVLSFPISYWISKSWLSNYAFRIEIGWVFVLPALLVPIMVLLTVGLQTIRAALVNPVDSLRNE